MTVRIKRGTAAQWAAANPVLLSGEPGLDTTNRIFKLGDGVASWESLPSLIDSFVSNPAANAAFLAAAQASGTMSLSALLASLNAVYDGGGPEPEAVSDTIDGGGF